MAQQVRSINAPALLRALADVLEQHPHCYPQLTIGSLLDPDGWHPQLGRVDSPVLDASFSAQIMTKRHDLNLAMGAAYKQHGGDPSAFLTAPELEMLEAAS